MRRQLGACGLPIPFDGDRRVSPDQFTRARAIFESALEAYGPERDRLVRDACGDDTGLGVTVERMLRAEGSPHVLLDGGPVLTSNRWDAGDAFLDFQSIALIGRGGMGEVYLVDGQTLAEEITEGPLAFAEAIAYARQIAGAQTLGTARGPRKWSSSGTGAKS